MVQVRLWTGEEMYCHKHFFDGRVPLKVGNVIEDVRIEITARLINGKLKQGAPET